MGRVIIDYPETERSHGNITPEGAIGTVANKAVFTGPNGVLQAGTLPVAAGGTGRATLTAGAFLRGTGTEAVTLTPAAQVLDAIGGVSAQAANTGWRKLYSRTTAGSFTWTAPDLFNRKQYYIGVLIIGGGGSGGAAMGVGTNGGNASGGASGHAFYWVMLVTPGTTCSGVVGAGGGYVEVVSSAPAISGNVAYRSGNNGGSTSFNGIAVEGGRGGGGSDSTYAAGGASGAQGSCVSGSGLDVNPYGGVLLSMSSAIANYQNVLQGPLYVNECFNPFEHTKILGAGGWARGSSGSFSYGRPGLNPVTGKGGGAPNQSTTHGNVATEPGCGGGGAVAKTMKTTVRSGAGADGAVMLYVQGAAA